MPVPGAAVVAWMSKHFDSGRVCDDHAREHPCEACLWVLARMEYELGPVLKRLMDERMGERLKAAVERHADELREME